MNNKKLRIIIMAMLLCIMNFTQVVYAEVYGSISGKVVNVDSGEPAKGIGITIDVLDRKKCKPLSCGYDNYKETDKNGKYVFEKVPQGEYKIDVIFSSSEEYNHYGFDTSMGRLSFGYSSTDCVKYNLFTGVKNYISKRFASDLPIKLLAGKNITDLNILIKKVYGTISGKILHQDNTPFNEKEVYIKSYTTEGKSADRDGTIIKENGLFKLNLLKDSPVWNLIISYPGWSTTGYRNAQYKYPQTIDTRGAKDIKDILIYPSFDTSYGLIANVYDTSNNKYGKNGIEVVLLHKNIYGDTEYSISCFTDEFGKVYFKGVLPGKYYIELCKYIIIEKVSKVSGKKRKTEGYKRYKYPGTIEIRYDSLKQRDLIYNENKAVEEESANFSMKCNSGVFFAQGDGADFANDCIKGCVDKTKDKCIQDALAPYKDIPLTKKQYEDLADPCLSDNGSGCEGKTGCDFSSGKGELVFEIWCDYGTPFYDAVEAHENVHKKAITDKGGCGSFTEDEYKTWSDGNRAKNEMDAYKAGIDNFNLSDFFKNCRSLPKELGFGNDWCDEQFAVNAPTIPTPIYYSQLPDVAILDNGASEQMQSLLSTFRYGNILTDINTTPQELLNYSKTLILPTGSLVGNDSSPQFKSLLEQYVSAGGFLVVMATQHNSDLGCIPVPAGDTLSGFMWREDMSCTANSIEIQNWHNILAGQSKNILSEPVDGYFTAWPSNSKILLRRSKNGQPCMLLYRYGSGWVLATTIYTDYGYSVGQASASGKALVRDIITWAKNPVEMAEYRPGSLINIPVTITNKTDKESVSASVNMLTPNGVEKQKISLNLPLQKGETGQYTYTGTAGNELGIWRIEYALLTGGTTVLPGTEIQKESFGANFVVSSPPAITQPSPLLSFSVQSDAENYARGSNPVFTIIAWNRSNEERIITTKYFFPHHYWNTHDNQYGGDWTHPELQLTEQLIIPPNSSTSFVHTLNNVSTSDRLWAYFYDEQGSKIGEASRAITVYLPSIQASVSLDKKAYKINETVNFTGNIKNLTSVSSNCNLQTYILSPLNQKIYDITESLNLDKNAEVIKSYSFTIPQDTPLGSYIICIDVYDVNTNNKIGGNSTYFTVPGAFISITPNLPSAWNTGDNNISLNITNIGELDVQNTQIKLEMKDPNLNVAYTETKTITNLLVGTNSNVDFNVILPNIIFGEYTLKYTVNYDNKFDGGINKITNQILTKTNTDKIKYTVLDNVIFNTEITNVGKFNINGTINLDFSNFGFQQTDNLSLNPSGTFNLNYSIPIPDNILAGTYKGKWSVNLSSGSKKEKDIEVTIPNYKLEIILPEGNYLSGNNMNVKIKNIGGIPIINQSEIYLRDINWFEMYKGVELTNPLLPEAEINLKIPISNEALSGEYNLWVDCRDKNSNKIVESVSKNIQIQGVDINTKISTDKVKYFIDENINGIAEFNVTSGNLQNAKLNYELIAEQGGINTFSGTNLNNVKCIKVGQNNDIWFGLDGGGAVYFDGVNWKTYTISEGMSGNSVEDILIDNIGNIWFATNNGLSKLTGNSFKKYSTADGFLSNNIKSIIQDRTGAIWVGTNGAGVSKFEGGIWTTPTASSLEPSACIRDIAEDENGTIWFATNKGISSYNNGAWINYDTSNGLIGSDITCVYPDKTGKLWIGTWGRGVAVFDGSNFKNISITSGLSDVFVTNIEEDLEGNIWIGTDNGLNKIIVQTQNFASVQKYYKENGLLDNHIESLVIDANGKLWVGTGKGINRVDSIQNTVDSIKYTAIPDKSGPLGNHVLSLLEDSTGVYLGTEMGLTKYIAETQNFASVQLSGFSNQPITGIAKDSGGYLWLGTSGNGIIVMSQESGAINQNYTKANGLLSNYVTAISYQPSAISQTIWVGTWGGGVSKFNGTTWTTYTKAEGLAGENVWAIAFETTGINWFGTDEGLSRLNGNSWTTYTKIDGLPINNISSIAIDKNNVKWIATWGGGVAKIVDNMQQTVVRVYTKADGLSGNYIYNVSIDDKGKIWCATDNGISVFDNISWQVIENGLPDNNIYTITHNKENTWAGSFGGFLTGLTPGNKILQNEILVNINANLSIPIPLGVVSRSGKVFFKARLNSNNGQLISEDETSFYTLDKNQDVYLSLNTDRDGYLLGQDINVTGKIENIKGEYLANVSVKIEIEETGEVVYENQFPLNSGDNYSFNFTTKSNSSFTLKATAKVSSSIVIYQKIIVAEPEIFADLTVPVYSSSKPFDAILKLENIGKVNANLTCNFYDTTFEILLEKGKKIVYLRKIITNKDENILVNITGDAKLQISKNVIFGENVDIAITTEQEYQEGQVEIPYTLSNIGQVESEVEIQYIVDSKQNTGEKIRENKIHYLPVGQTLSDVLQYELTKGEYSLNYSIKPSAFNLQPSAFVFDSGKISFVVKKENDLMFDAIADSNTSDGKINVTVNLNNIGINDFSGILLIQSPFSRNEEIINLIKGNTGTYQFALIPTGAIPGKAEITASVLYSGNVILQKKISVDIYAPTFEFVSVPQYPVYRLGRFESMSFIVKNTGNLQGEAEVKLTILDILDNSQKLWLAPGEQRTVTFEFTIPDDIEQKEHKAQVKLGSNSFEVPFKIEGIKLNVTAFFDKQYYAIGETARLTIDVENQDTTYMPNMFVRVNYHAFDSSRDFILVNKQTFSFNIPVDKFNGEKVFYGIYMASGRSIWLNTIYLYEQKDIFNITTDKQVYKPGETVFVTAASMYPGTLSYSSFNNKADIEINGRASFLFVLPQKVTAGTYDISCKFSIQNTVNSIQEISGTYPFDIDGISIKIVECNLDKGKYNSNDTIKTYINIESNVDINTKLNADVIDPDTQNKAYVNTYVPLTKGENKINLEGNLSAQVPGIHRLSYRIYDQDSDLSLAGGQEAFDVGDMMLTGLSADKADYPEGYETAYITANFYSQGNNTGNLKIQKTVDGIQETGEIIIDEQVTLSGFENKIYKITPSETGEIKLVGELLSGNLTSTKEINFTYGSNLPDLVINNFTFNMPEEYGDSQGTITIGVKNVGKSGTSQDGIVSVSVNSVRENISFGSLDANYESTIIYKLAISNQLSAISYQLSAMADSQNAIKEYNENNNNSQIINVTIPYLPQINPISAYVNDTTLIISGNGTPETQAIIYLNGTNTATAQVNLQGEFAASINPAEGENTVCARTIDNSENKSLYSNQVKFIRDTVVPAINISGVENGKYYNKDVSAIISVNDANLNASRIKLNNQSYISAAPIIEENNYILQVYGDDLAGNTTSKEINFTIDKTPPQIPTLTFPKNGDILTDQVVNIRGTAEQNSIVILKIGDKTYTTIADENKEFIFSYIILADGENIINISAEDKAGNASESLSAKIIVKLVALVVKKEISNKPRVLVYTENQNKQIVQKIFESTEINYAIVDGRAEEFINELRTGKYNVYIMFGDNKKFERISAKEIMMRIYGGDGAIASSEIINKEPNFLEIFGIKYKGHLSDKNNIINFTDTTLCKQNTLETKEKAQKIKIETAEMLGYITSTPDKIHNGKIKSISLETNYEFTEDKTYAVTVQVYDGDKVKEKELLDEEKDEEQITDDEKREDNDEIDNNNNDDNKINLVINEIEEDKIRFSLVDNKEDEKLQGEYTIRVIIEEAKGKGQKVEKIIGPITIKIDKCTTPKEGDIMGAFTITEIEKESKCCTEEKEPAIVINKYGEGKAIYFTIDLLKSYDAKTKNRIREIVLNSITQVTPGIISPELFGSIPIEIDIENKGKEVDLKVTEFAPEGTIIATGNQLPVTSIEWQIKLLENENKKLPYYLQTPDVIAVYTPITEIRYLDYDSSYKWYGKYVLDIDVNYDKKSLINEITIDLNSLALTKEEEQKRKDIIKFLQKIETEENKEKNIKYCLKSMDLLTKIKSTQITQIHYKFIKLLKICERKKP